MAAAHRPTDTAVLDGAARVLMFLIGDSCLAYLLTPDRRHLGLAADHYTDQAQKPARELARHSLPPRHLRTGLAGTSRASTSVRGDTRLA